MTPAKPVLVVSHVSLLAVLALVPNAQEGATELNEREAAFQELMSGCRMVGAFTADDAPADQPPQEDAYTIERVVKVGGDDWRFTALMEFANRRIPVNLVVQVHWAGDTPVISVTDQAVPLAGTYSARVLVHGRRYAGTWSGKEHGGHLFGRIVKDGEDPGEAPGGAADGRESGGQAGGGGEGGDGGDGGDRSDGDGGPRTGVDWPGFRGPRASGVAEGYPLPSAWDVEAGEGVRWRTPIPGLAHSSPAVWGDRVYLTTAVRSGGEARLEIGLSGSIAPVDDEGPHRFDVLCLDKASGDVLWTRTAFEGVPGEKRHPKGSFAASSPATDGEHVVAFFGTEGLFAYDADGELLWRRDLGTLDAGFFMVPGAQWGFASSPVIHDDLVLVQCDVQGDSFLAALRLADGSELWRTPRDEVPTWCSPTVHVGDGRTQVIVNGYKHIGGYSLADGHELWKLAGGGDIPVPTPVLGDELVFITSSHGRMSPIYAVRLDATGEVTMDEDDASMEWSDPRRGIYLQTPLLYGDYLYLCSNNGILACHVAATGDEVYRERLGAGGIGFTSSGVAGDGKLYFASEEGEVLVVAAGEHFEVLATNPLGEPCMATPALSEGALYYRTRSHVVAIGG